MICWTADVHGREFGTEDKPVAEGFVSHDLTVGQFELMTVRNPGIRAEILGNGHAGGHLTKDCPSLGVLGFLPRHL